MTELKKRGRPAGVKNKIKSTPLNTSHIDLIIQNAKANIEHSESLTALKAILLINLEMIEDEIKNSKGDY